MSVQAEAVQLDDDPLPPPPPPPPIFCGPGANFRIDITFEMRTVFSGIRLFNHKSERIVRVFISKWKEGKESKIAERPRESECERQSFAEREGGSVGNKTDS
jgi:hypothetical protein